MNHTQTIQYARKAAENTEKLRALENLQAEADKRKDENE